MQQSSKFTVYIKHESCNSISTSHAHVLDCEVSVQICDNFCTDNALDLFEALHEDSAKVIQGEAELVDDLETIAKEILSLSSSICLVEFNTHGGTVSKYRFTR